MPVSSTAIKAALCGALLALPAAAQDVRKITFQDFERPEFVRVADLLPERADNMLVLSFWDRDCAPCLVELAHLPSLADRNTDMRFAAVATGDVRRSRQWLTRRPMAKSQRGVDLLRVANDPAGIMREMGNARGAYPFNVAVNHKGEVCAYGARMLDQAGIGVMRKACKGK
ncbi:MAG: hypothetical protein QM645_01405 [Asticcacaulis sp.]